MAVSAFCFSQSLFRRFIWILSTILAIAYIYVAIYGRVAIDKKTIVRFQEGMREGFNRGASGLGLKKGGWDSVSHDGHAETEIKPPRNIDLHPLHNHLDQPIDEELSAETFEKGTKLARSMMQHAWDGYRKYAWGEDELMPLTRGAAGMLGPHSLMVSIVDSLDTLMLMRMDAEYAEARDLVLRELNFDKPMSVSLFECNIRILGGLLSAFALSGDGRYLTKSFDLAQRFMMNFNEFDVFPPNELDLLAHMKMKESTNITLSRHLGAVALAQVGTFSLEFGYLSDILNDPAYINAATAIIEKINRMKTTLPGLYPATLMLHTTEQGDEYYTFGGQADSFYEYLLKYWLYTGKRDKLHLSMYEKAVAGMKRHLIQRRNGHVFLATRNGKHLIEEQEHLSCFAPGMLALGAAEVNDKETLKLAEEIAESCYLMYHRQKYGLSPEKVNINNLRPVLHNTYWSQRPEALESFFILWRLTKDTKYRRWGYEIAQNIEKHARIAEGGYSGIKNIISNPIQYNDRQESYLLAETFKYLYLLFGPSDVLPLDRWVFNTEAHPIPINWRGVPYQASSDATGKAPFKDDVEKGELLGDAPRIAPAASETHISGTTTATKEEPPKISPTDDTKEVASKRDADLGMGEPEDNLVAKVPIKAVEPGENPLVDPV